MAKVTPPTVPQPAPPPPEEQKETTALAQPAPDITALASLMEDDTSLQTMSQYVNIPRIKIIQSQTDATLKETFGEGNAILRPGDILVAKKGVGFRFVPLFFFSEYCLWNDYKDKERPGIQERTFDENHEIAKRSKDKTLRSKIYPGHENKPDKDKRYQSYVQHLCLPGILYGDHSLASTPCVISFERGEYFTGKSFLSAIQMRRENFPGNIRKCPPLWSQCWELFVDPKQHTSPQGQWWGFGYRAAGLADQNDFPSLKAQHLELATLHQAKLIRVDHADNLGDTAPAAAETPAADAPY